VPQIIVDILRRHFVAATLQRPAMSIQSKVSQPIQRAFYQAFYKWGNCAPLERLSAHSTRTAAPRQAHSNL